MSFASNSGLLAVTSASEVGMIEDCSASTLPTGYLYCNGQTVNTADYPELAAALGESGATMVLPAVYPEKEYIGGTDFDVTGYGDTTTANDGVVRAVLTPYKTDDGAWRARLNISGTLDSGATSCTLTISGVTFKNGASWQPVSVFQGSPSSTGIAYVTENTSTLVGASAASLTTWDFSGDVELDSKPSWVDDNSPSNYSTYKVIRYAPKTALQGVSVASVVALSADTSISLAQISNNDIFNVTTGSSANVTITLPEGDDSILYKTFKIIKADSGTKFVAIARSGSDTIRGSATSIYAIQQYEAIELMWNGSEYQLLGEPMRTQVAMISASNTVTWQRCSWVSSVSSDSGGQQCTLFTGVFLSAPAPQAITYSTSFSSQSQVRSVTTATTVKIANSNGTTKSDFDFYITCTGLK